MSNTIDPSYTHIKNKPKMKRFFIHLKKSVTKIMISNTIYYKSAKTTLKRSSK